MHFLHVNITISPGSTAIVETSVLTVEPSFSTLLTEPSTSIARFITLRKSLFTTTRYWLLPFSNTETTAPVSLVVNDFIGAGKLPNAVVPSGISLPV